MEAHERKQRVVVNRDVREHSKARDKPYICDVVDADGVIYVRLRRVAGATYGAQKK